MAAVAPDPSLVALLLAQPQMLKRLAPEHADDGTSHCRSCSSGAQTGRYIYPCAIRLAVDEANHRTTTKAAVDLAQGPMQ